MKQIVRRDSPRSRSVGFALLLSSVTLFAPLLSHAQEGVTTKRELRAVRVETPPVLDGDLGDACWQQAAKADRFTDVLFGNPVADQTVASLCYDDRNIYIAFYAYDSKPQEIVARETKRGTRFNTDDRVAFSIDTFHTHKFADRSFFLINPIGTQFARLGGERATKLEWEGAWKAATKIVADGWIVEVAIPWSILNYPAVKGPTTCGINFDRTQQRTKIQSWWSNLGQNEFNELDGHWVGIEFPAYRPQLSLLPFTSPGWEEGNGAGLRSGLDLRYTPSPSLTLVSTLNPDFANIEGAVEGIDFSYGERFVPDRRPFFLEGASVYRAGSFLGRYFHSLRIGDMDTGLNLYGKVTPRDTVGLLGAIDLGHRADWVLRGRHEFGSTSSVDVALINRDSSEVTNRVAVVGENFRRGFFGLDASWAGSFLGGRHAGDAANAFIGYQTPRFATFVIPHYIRPGFRDDLGFIRFTDYKGVYSDMGYFTQWRKGTLRSFNAYVSYNHDDHYDGRPFRRRKSAEVGVQTRSDYSLNLSWEGGLFEEFDDSVYQINWRARASDPFHTFSIGYSWGREADHSIAFITPSVTWRFGEKVTFGVASSILRHIEDREQHIFTFNYDFSPRQGIGGRVVAQTGGTNGYLAYRRSGYGGVETWLILGDPNALKFRQRLVAKVIWPM